MSRAARRVLNAEPSDTVSASGYVQMNAPEISIKTQRCRPQRKDCVRNARAEQINGLRTTWREHTVIPTTVLYIRAPVNL